MSTGASHDVSVLFRQHGHRVYRRALRILGSSADAEEAVQEVFIRALRHPSDGRGERELLAWLYVLTTNWCLTQIRDRKHRARLLERHLPAPDGGEPSVGPRGEELLLVRSLLASVEERQAQAAVLTLLDGMSHEEAAEVLGVSRRTVGNLMERFEKAMDARREDDRQARADEGGRS